MSHYCLNDIEMFAELKARIEAVTPEDLATLSPGKPVPAGAEVIGELSPALMALLFVRDSLIELSVRSMEEYFNRLGSMTLPEAAEQILHQGEQAHEAQYYATIFSMALWRKFERSVDYGPEFEVYALDKSPVHLGNSFGERIEKDIRSGRLIIH